MNKSKIEWCDMTWNPVTGCLNSCHYCYARKIANRFNGNFCIRYGNLCCLSDFASEKIINPEKSNGRILLAQYNPMFELVEPLINKNKTESYPFGFYPTFHKYRLKEPQKNKKPQNIFVCSMADLFGDWVPDDWKNEVFDACENAPQHNYLYLTKFPKNLTENGFYRAGKNLWYGTTITKESEVCNFNYLPAQANRFVSIEPLVEDLEIPVLHPLLLSSTIGVHWIIVGAETGNRKGKIIPEKKWIDDIVEACTTANIPVFMKDSLVPIIGEENMLREMPKGLIKEV